ncbi:MAG: ABC transporter ATP-binding protein [Polyangiaceae bacterium]
MTEFSSAIVMRDLGKDYKRGGDSLRILDSINLDIRHGAFEALMGPSGSGKSTLLNVVAGLDRPTRGTIQVAGARLDPMTDAELARFRARHLGIVFQTYNLLPVLSAVENVMLPLLLFGFGRSERRRRAEAALSLVGLEHRMKHYPAQLSGGQEQRVAIARAIVNDPDVIIADEPTGDLDRQSADEVLELFVRLSKEMGKTILMVTHDPQAAARAETVHHLDKGALS